MDPELFEEGVNDMYGDDSNTSSDGGEESDKDEEED